MRSQPQTRIHAPRNEFPPRRSQARQMAQGFDPCWVMTQQSPHNGLWHRAQGPAALDPQAQRAMLPPPSPVPMSCPVMSEASRPQPQRASLRRLLTVGFLTQTLLASAGCASGAISYRGQSQTPTLTASQLQERATAPENHRLLGEVAASCRRVEVAEGFEAVSWSDLGCSPELLRRAIAQKAAAQGATMLVDSECDGLESSSSGIDCSAQAWANKGSDSANSGLPEVSPSLVSATGSERIERAWLVYVDSHLTTASGVQRAAAVATPISANAVRELAVIGMQDFRLGDLTAYCETGQCDEQDLRGGLRAAAGRVGADALVAVRCFSPSEGPRCVASIARSPTEQ